MVTDEAALQSSSSAGMTIARMTVHLMVQTHPKEGAFGLSLQSKKMIQDPRRCKKRALRAHGLPLVGESGEAHLTHRAHHALGRQGIRLPKCGCAVWFVACGGGSARCWRASAQAGRSLTDGARELGVSWGGPFGCLSACVGLTCPFLGTVMRKH